MECAIKGEGGFGTRRTDHGKDSQRLHRVDAASGKRLAADLDDIHWIVVTLLSTMIISNKSAHHHVSQVPYVTARRQSAEVCGFDGLEIMPFMTMSRFSKGQ